MARGAVDLLRLGLALVLAFGLIFAAGPGQAQLETGATVSETAPDYDVWESTAKRAEAAVEAGTASNRALEELRGAIVTWRESFLTAQDPPGRRTGPRFQRQPGGTANRCGSRRGGGPRWRNEGP